MLVTVESVCPSRFEQMRSPEPGMVRGAERFSKANDSETNPRGGDASEITDFLSAVGPVDEWRSSGCPDGHRGAGKLI